MARLVFPDEGTRSSARVGGLGSALGSAAYATALVYLDVAGTSPALDLLTEAGAPLTSGRLQLDGYSRLPLFSGPDGVDTLYVSVDGGPVTPINARVDDRLDALASRVTAIEAGGGGGLTVEQIQDLVSAMVVAGTNVTTSYNDPAGTLTVSATVPAGLTQEQVEDFVGAMATDSSTLDFTYDDTAGTLTAVVKAATVTTAMLAFDVATQAELDAAIAAEVTRTAGAFAPSAQAGTTIGTSSMVGEEIVVTYSSVWGINGAGEAYYDSAGAAPGEAAVLHIDSTTGAVVVTKPEGANAP